MRRGLIHTGAWLLATGAAVTLSWWGVHTVMSGTVYDPPRALPIPSAAPERGSLAEVATPQSSSTHRPSEPPATKRPPSRPPERRTATPDRQPEKPPPPAATGRLKPVNTDAGRVVFSMGEDSAKLVSAVPNAGWAMQVWKDPSWIRVEYTAGAARLTVFCSWHDHPPLVEITKS
ncbi:hypothetical protein GCM10010329_37070 [Streptomyces spiroverticillatus]|uniref:Secreted protein n=1 Tax=Streptomyces finlayi TaxID=67296 RepID=A0A919CAC5_9ACTN|nr:hypothetical protein [Streptomyces finlayi]GHA10826.1 hypothetical protein GCM10010329_37070 [Streptomyces spiroverticillatus]GHC95355.1 hypothetical protein GCM10010334_34540 [Streptomyces finlayi]